MGATFKCIKDTTYKVRIIHPGDTVTVRDDVVKSMTGHPCWEPVDVPKAARAKAAKAKDEPKDSAPDQTSQGGQPSGDQPGQPADQPAGTAADLG